MSIASADSTTRLAADLRAASTALTSRRRVRAGVSRVGKNEASGSPSPRHSAFVPRLAAALRRGPARGSVALGSGLAFLALGLGLAGTVERAEAHCQIPCGIFEDDVRFRLMEEHITTIEKSMQQILEIGAKDEKNWNQLVRWVENKETHADLLVEIITEYFLQQRIKPFEGGDAAARDKYVAELTACHEILVRSMKAKQTTDLAHVEALRTLLHDLAHSYLGQSHQH